jgi:S1-C subfamily serine protease
MLRKYLLICGISAVVGAALAYLAARRDPVPSLAAQEPGFSTTTPGRPADSFRFSAPAAAPEARKLTSEEQVNISVYETVSRGVVNINTRGIPYDSFFFLELPAEGLGSGSVLDHEGHILTNYHVVEGARQIEVTLFNGKPYPARLVGHDPVDDIAVLKIDATPSELFPVVLGDSGDLKVGQRVYAIGSPFELERTFTTGIVSSLNRTLPSRRQPRVMKSIIQIDAAMNPGNSGGPLVDTSAQVIGMNTAIASRTGQNTGVGFAIPVNRIKRVIDDLIRFGKVSRPDIGIFEVVQTEQGLLIRSLVPGGPAEQAGLRGFRVVRRRERQGFFNIERKMIDPGAADLITGVDGTPIQTADDFLSLVETKKPGDEVVLTVVRAGRAIQVPVRLAAGES